MNQRNNVFFIPLGFIVVFMIISCKESQQISTIIEENSDKVKAVETKNMAVNTDEVYQVYLDYFEKVYQTMNENYYVDIPREAYDRFIEKFRTKIYSQLKETGKSDDFVRWRSAAYMVEDLRTAEDPISALFPPEPAKEFEQKVLGVRIDLGITGSLTEQGFKVSHVEPRSDAYGKGLRIDNIITELNKTKIAGMGEDSVKDMLNPLSDQTVWIKYLDENSQEKEFEALPKEYFKQTVFMMPIKAPGIFGIEVRQFNRMTAEDMYRYFKFFEQHGPILGLVIDLRGNPGGPPLAAREMSAFFMNEGEEFAYFQKKGQPESRLDVPNDLPFKFKYNGPMVILVNEGSGSSSELFSGVMQKNKRAVILGRNTAGQVFLKSMFNLDDGSMILLITSRGNFPDGSYFSLKGVTPDRYIEKGDEENLLNYAITYLYYIISQKTT